MSAGVRLDHMNMVKGPTGHALVMIQPGGKRTTVVVQGANVSWPRLADGINRLTTTVQQLIRRAGAVLLQREVPDSVNMEAAKVLFGSIVHTFLTRKNKREPKLLWLLQHSFSLLLLSCGFLQQGVLSIFVLDGF